MQGWGSVATRFALADAAKAYDWPRVFELVSEYTGLINCCRPDGKSLYSPLHQAAHAGAAPEVINRMIAMGAWRTLQNARGERPLDVAERKGHLHLLEVLDPVVKHRVPIGVLLKVQSHFHELIRNLADPRMLTPDLRLPELEPLLELDRPQMWFLVPGMCQPYSGYGRFSYRLETGGVDAKLISETWTHGQQRHEITSEGWRPIRNNN